MQEREKMLLSCRLRLPKQQRAKAATDRKREEFVVYYVPLYGVTNGKELPHLRVNYDAGVIVKICIF